MTAERKKQQTNKQEAETRYKYSQIKSFSSRLAKLSWELRLSMNLVKNFRLRLTIKLDTGLILNMTQHTLHLQMINLLADCSIVTSGCDIFTTSKCYNTGMSYFAGF